MPNRLIWDPIEGADHYKVFRKVEGETVYLDIATIADNFLPLASLLSGIPARTAVSFQVCAWDAGLGLGGILSNEVTGRVPFPAVQNLRVE